MPVVVGSLKSPHAGTQKKVLEILSHVNKRLKALPRLRLPTADLLTLFTGATGAAAAATAAATAPGTAATPASSTATSDAAAVAAVASSAVAAACAPAAVAAVAATATTPPPPPLVKNFALVYLEMACDRADPAEQIALVSLGC